MKMYLFSTVLIMSFFTGKGLPQKHQCSDNKIDKITDTVPTYLASLNLQNFIGKPIDSFIAKIPASYTSMKVYGGHNPKVASQLSVSYPNGVEICIYARNFQFINPRSETLTWDITLFRKEKLSKVIIYNGTECINGCLDYY